jgi:hypothetical protein
MDTQSEDSMLGPKPRNAGREADARRGRIMGGVVLVVLGVLFLLRNIFPWFRFEDYWPVILIAIGCVLIVRSRTEQ